MNLSPIAALFLFAPAIAAQQPAPKPMGSVATTDAQVSGGLEVSGSRAVLLTNASVTARDHTAEIDLARGGLVNVCTSSAFHLLRSGPGDALLFALDRGAMEIHSSAQSEDTILTPDLRFTMLTPGPLDLRMRVTREGDTCVDNHGDTAPVLKIVDSFGTSTYHLAPGQHVLFEHGSLREVVDNERSNCGCPTATPAMVASATTNATSADSSQQAAALHPFPVAESEGLTTKPSVVAITSSAPAGDSLALSYHSSAPPPAVASVAAGASSAPTPTAAPSPTSTAVFGASTSSAPPPAPPGAHDIAHAIGRFFHRLFHRGN